MMWTRLGQRPTFLAIHAPQMSDAVSRILEELQRLGALRPTQAFAREHEIPSARSWDALAESVVTAAAGEDLDTDALLEFFALLRCSARKSFTLYAAEEEDIEALQHFVDEAHEEADEQWEGFPVPIDEGELDEADEKPTLAGVVACGDGHCLVYCSRRTFNAREDVPIDAIRREHRRDFRNARLIAERRITFQAFDCVYVPNDAESPIQIRIDAQHVRTADVYEYRRRVEAALCETMGWSADALTPLNLFPAVRSIYDDYDEGRIIEIHHECTTGASRRESMRRTNDASVDLRDEAYHVAGSTAVKGIDPYRISVEWVLDDNRSVAATLPGTLRMLHASEPLYILEIEGFPEDSDVDHVLDAISRHVEDE
jgi:hypothetical protein